MKVFIGGARQLHTLNESVIEKLNNILAQNFDILIGDANGIDTSVQKYCHDHDYKNVTVYASNGRARNNIGNWEIKNVQVDKNVTGFDFYAAKDFKMAQDADCGFMIWNGKSRGTWNNVVNLCRQKKVVVIYVSVQKKIRKFSNIQEAMEFKEYLENSSTPNIPQDFNLEDSQLRLF